ncbi:MAG TPA: phospholipid carrier-dependent glycosyltransferase [Novosphingobium sp.]|nr:phospholipid carrier-dependent glycosyltransferase [Novosphingobium sp.]
MKAFLARSPARQRDPLGWCAALALAFAALAGWRLGTPGRIYFDEVHYVPAARALLALIPANPEHPLFAKLAIAAAIATLGDQPAVWRLPSLVAGAIGLFAFGRALWWASGRRFATIAGMVLLASDFAWFIQSRIAMLDMVMAGLGLVALGLVAGAIGLPQGAPAWQRRWRLAGAGLALGLAMGAKWSVLPLCAGLVLAVLAARALAIWRMGGETAATLPIPGISLAELALWLISLPLVAYAATFTPAFFYHSQALAPTIPGLVAWHRYMVALQASVIKPHPYQSHWWQWVIDWRAIWYLYEPVDGIQRGIVLIGNPVSMLAGLPALVWCLWAGWRGRRLDAAAAVGFYALTLGLWVVAHKPVQFYYHYLLPGTFLMAALALALDDIWQAGGPLRWAAPALVAAAVAVFAWFYPIIAAMPLHHGVMSFEDWMWLDSWR